MLLLLALEDTSLLRLDFVQGNFLHRDLLEGDLESCYEIRRRGRRGAAMSRLQLSRL